MSAAKTRKVGIFIEMPLPHLKMEGMKGIFEIPESPSGGEVFQTLAEGPGTRIERIVSFGRASPPGFWYDQDEDEWVCVARGEASLLFEGEDAPRRLAEGAALLIPRGARHRVESVSNPCVWIAVFGSLGGAPAGL